MVNATLLRRFVPLAALNPSDLAEIARGARAGNYQPGQVIFGRGDSAATAIYLVRGTDVRHLGLARMAEEVEGTKER